MPEPIRLSQRLEDLARYSGITRFMDRDGEKIGVELPTWRGLLDCSPLIEVAGKEVLVQSPVPYEDHLWHLRLQQFFKRTDQGLLYYYIPIPTELEIPESWRG